VAGYALPALGGVLPILQIDDWGLANLLDRSQQILEGARLGREQWNPWASSTRKL
jgi:hypothetical protein